MNSLSKWFIDSEKERIYLDQDDLDGAWVDIKAKLSIGDQDTLGQLLFDIKVDTGNPDGLPRSERRRRARQGESINASYKPSTVALLQVAIVDWSFLDDNNDKVPITPEWIARLKPEWANRIEEEIDQRNPLVEPKTQENIETP